MLTCYVNLHIISQHAKILNTASRYSRRLSVDMIIPMFSFLDTTENVPHLGDGRVAGRKVALRTSAPRKTSEIGAEESALGAGTAAGPGPETGKEPGESLQTCVQTRPGDGLRNQWRRSHVVSAQPNKPFPVTIIVHINSDVVFSSVQNCENKSAYLPVPTKIVMVFLNGNIFPSVICSFVV